VVLLTALGSVEERVAGLRAGADDYVVKPFAFVELLARLEAVWRRAVDRPPPRASAGDLTLDLATRRVERAGAEIDLTPTEFSILELLMRHAGQVVTRKMLCEHLWEADWEGTTNLIHAGQVVTRKMLCEHLWEADWEGTTNLIEVHINRLRKKLDRERAEPSIQTVRGRGYALRAP
jgi:two-component system OmpR family response regulator/two-component system copper resistance phosphate regulon response regulator CusR